MPEEDSTAAEGFTAAAVGFMAPAASTVATPTEAGFAGGTIAIGKIE